MRLFHKWGTAIDDILTRHNAHEMRELDSRTSRVSRLWRGMTVWATMKRRPSNAMEWGIASEFRVHTFLIGITLCLGCQLKHYKHVHRRRIDILLKSFWRLDQNRSTDGKDHQIRLEWQPIVIQASLDVARTPQTSNACIEWQRSPQICESYTHAHGMAKQLWSHELIDSSHSQINWLHQKLINKCFLVDWLNGWLTRSIVWSVDWLIDWSVDWLHRKLIISWTCSKKAITGMRAIG